MNLDSTSPLVRIEGPVGRITLNRPDSMNALDLAVIRHIELALTNWRDNPEVEAVIIDHESDRAFCAGGDVMLLAESARKDCAAAAEYFSTQNRMILLLADYAKPTVCVMNGVALGGGAGVGMACRHRVGTERFSIGFGETGVGLVPDVGATRLLKHMPKPIAAWLILSGQRIKAEEAIRLGLLDYFVPQAKLAHLLGNLGKEPQKIEAAIHDYAEAPPHDRQVPTLSIQRCFEGFNTQKILESLEALDDESAIRIAKVIRRNSPAAGDAALAMLAAIPDRPTLKDSIDAEFETQLKMLRHGDFSEWARAFLFERDKVPHWASRG